MKVTELIEAIEEAGHEAYSYSGRGMYGRRCVAFTAEDVSEACLILGSILGDSASEFGCGGICTDSMGMDYVIYFPYIEWEHKEETNE